MKKFSALVLVALVSLVSMVSAQAAGNPIRSLNDLPKEWTGVAGDLFTRTPAALTISRITGIDRRVDGPALNILYTVEATLKLGERTIGVKSLWLQGYYSLASNNVEIYISLDDELVQTLFVIISYDEATDTFTMRDPIQNGAHHLLLKGKAPHAL